MLRTLTSLFAIVMLAGSLAAQEAPAKPVADLIKQLDAESFADRQAASNELVRRGKEALPALAEAAKSASAETATRSLDVLRKQLDSSDAALQAAAKEALTKLAGGEGDVARRAAELLKPKPQTPAGQQAPAPAIGGIPAFGGGAIRIAVAAAGGGGGAKRMSVKDVDGVKEIEVVEGDRTIKINNDPAKGIKVKVTDKKDGKEETKEYEAKNAAELKEKHPEAHKLYEQYKSGGAEIRFDVFPGLPGGFAPLPAVPVPGVPVPALPALRPAIIPDAKGLSDKLSKAAQQLDNAAAKLKKLSETSGSADIKAALEAVEQSKKDLEEVRAKLP